MHNGFQTSQQRGEIERWMPTLVSMACMGIFALGLGAASCDRDNGEREAAADHAADYAGQPAGDQGLETSPAVNPEEGEDLHPTGGEEGEDPHPVGREEGEELYPASGEEGKYAHPVNGEGEEDLHPVSYEEAEGLYLEGRYDEAAGAFGAYIETVPANSWAHYMHGLSCWKSGRHEEAEAAFLTALKGDPDHVKSHINLARVLLTGDRPSEALDRARAAIDLDPHAGAAYRVLGRAYHNLGLTAKAIESYGKALQIDDRDVWAMNNLALLYIQAERFVDALPPLARAAQLRGDVSTFRNNLGVALERAGHYGAAVDAYRAALEIDGSHSKAATSLARVEALHGQPGQPPVDLGALAERFAEGISPRQVVASERPEETPEPSNPTAGSEQGAAE